MCNSCGFFGGITFPNFVGQSCCNPCCQSSGSVGGVTSENSKKCCFCFDCESCGSGSTGGSGSSSGTTGCGCKRCAVTSGIGCNCG